MIEQGTCLTFDHTLSIAMRKERSGDARSNTRRVLHVYVTISHIDVFSKEYRLVRSIYGGLMLAFQIGARVRTDAYHY